MHYMIVKWNQPALKWDVIHYSHNTEDFEKSAARFPESEGYVHLLEINSEVYHQQKLRIKAAMEKLKNATN